MTRLALMALACAMALAGPAYAADPVPEPTEEPDLSNLRLTAPPRLPPFDPALIARIRAALAAADAGTMADTPPKTTHD